MNKVASALLVLVLLGAGHVVLAQLLNPIPAPITKQGLRVEIKDVARLPDTRGLRPASEDVAPTAWARVNFVRELPDGRRFANDMRGLLYVLDRNGQPSVYANVAAAFPLGWYRSLQTGFVNFEFHPEFATNGLFYTVHGERGPGNPGTPNFIPPGFTADEITYQTVITEWRAATPSANVFNGTQARTPSRRSHRQQPFPSTGGPAVQPAVEAGRGRLRAALHRRR